MRRRRRKVLITGGQGALGRSLTRKLIEDGGWTVVVQDVREPPSTATVAGQDEWNEWMSRKGVEVATGDITQQRHLNELFGSGAGTSNKKWSRLLSRRSLGLGGSGSGGYAGIIHLAGVSRRQWCAERESECERVNVGGTRALLGKASEGADLPWVVYVSTMDAARHDDGEHDSSSSSALGRVQHAAERLLDDYRGQHAVVRLGSVYGLPAGQDIPERLVPSLVRRTLTGSTVQIVDGDEQIDLIHVEDAVRGLTAVMERISQASEATNTDEKAPAVASRYDLVSGHVASPRDVYNTLIRLLGASSSPVQDLTGGSSTSASSDVTPLAHDLGLPAALSLEHGLKRVIDEARDAFKQWALSHLARQCPSSSRVTHAVLPEADVRNRHVERLAGCTVNIGVKHDQVMHHVKCGTKDGVTCIADNVKQPGYNWNQTVFTIERVHEKRHAPGRRPASYDDSQITVRFIEEQTSRVLGFRRKQSGKRSRAIKAHPIKLALLDPKEIDDANVHSAFHPVIASNSSEMQLLVAGTNERLTVTQVTTSTDRFETIAASVPGYDFRMQTLCCPTSEPWPLLLDDYEAADIRYGSTGDIPWKASKRNWECEKVERALERVEQTPDLRSTSLSPRPSQWRDKLLTTCMNDCSNPLVCVKTDDCRCIHADECPVARQSPLEPRWQRPVTKLISITTQDDFVRAVRRKNWRDMLLPEASRIIDGTLKVHVVSGYEGEAEIEAAACHKLQDNHCFSADSIAYRAMRSVSVPANEADLIVIPVYQHCDGAPFILHDVMAYADKTIPHFKERPVALYMTHDWGICKEFAWNIWDARTDNKLYPDWILDNVFVWQPMGDAISKCYRPQQDIVVPPRTCLTNKLRESFGDVHNVKPAALRPYLITWSGTQWGTGKSARLRLTCDRGGEGKNELVSGAGPQSRWFHWDYMSELSNARFCPQPTGVAGWSFRVQDAIYAGCIPILMSEGTHFPFAHVLDWTKFSIRISPTELDHLEDILTAIPIERVEEMQANLMAIREAFLYSPDESPEDELDRHGPVWFAMQSARIMIASKYPTKV